MIRRIVIPTCVGLILVIFVIAYLEKHFLEKALLQEAYLQTYEDVLKEVPKFLEEQFFIDPFASSAQERLRAFLQEIRTSPMARLTVWNKEHLIIYTNLKSLIGQRSPDHIDLRRLFAEERPFFIRKTEDTNWPQQSALGEFLDIYVPIRVSGKIVGAVEIHSMVSGILAPVDNLKYYTAAILAASGLAILIIGLLAKSIKEDRDRQNALAVRTAELYEQTRKQSVELRRSNSELEQFAYVASHDLQEPLRMVSGYAQLFAKRYTGVLDADADEFIHYMLDGATRMQRLITDLLAYSRVGTKGKEFAKTECGAVLEKVLHDLRVAIEGAGAVITHDRLPEVIADRIQLGQLFQNLIGNAVKYHDGRRPEIHVSCNRENEMWRFSVRDNGIGIPPKDVERVFQIFQRLHPREEFDGTGIGLAVCKKIVERHGGRIWVESALSEGSTFYFTLPAG